MTYFELFQLPYGFAVDLGALTITYRDLQKAVHPDKFANASSHEQLMAVQKTAEINDALATLKHPLRRAEYMLHLMGVDIRAEQQTLQDPAFLMAQMELREALDDARHADNPDAALATLTSQTQSDIDQYFNDLTPILDAQDQANAENAADFIRKLKFLYKFLDEIERLEDELFSD